uniref:Uncharacterized protein n=1 Tax=Anguilla anguilla TaxID=7936 RepID=A0A0E9VTC6_ANGAN
MTLIVKSWGGSLVSWLNSYLSQPAT